MRDVFISHAKHNRKFVIKLVTRLEADGYSCWVAPRDLDLSEDPGDAILDALNSVRCVLFVNSPQSARTRDVVWELENAHGWELPIIDYKTADFDVPKNVTELLDPEVQVPHSNDFEVLLSDVKRAVDENGLDPEDIAEAEGEEEEDDQQKTQRSILIAIAIVLVAVAGYYFYTSQLGGGTKAEYTGTWRLVDFVDPLQQLPEQRQGIKQSLAQSPKVMQLATDGSFVRQGFAEVPEKGSWQIDESDMLFTLKPVNSEMSDKYTLNKLTMDSLVFSVQEDSVMKTLIWVKIQGGQP